MSDQTLLVTDDSGLLDAPLGSPTRPTWRGRLHLIGLWIAIPLVIALVVAAHDARARAAVIVYGAGLCSMLAVSTTYHRWVHTVRSRDMWRRADHATIFAAIAGTCTALALTTLSTGAAIAMVVVVWLAALAGAAFKVVGFDRAHWLGGPMYIALGWSGLALVPAVWRSGGALPAVLMLGGGLMYTGGAVVFGRQWPTLRPARFSYHEVWHACTIVAAGLHFATVSVVAT
jgi:hemolysin III